MAMQLKTIYIGPNVHLPVPAIRWTVTQQPGAAWRSPGSALAFVTPLFAHLPALRERLEAALTADALAAPAGAPEGPAVSELAMHVAMALQAAAGHAGTLARLVPSRDGSRVDIVCEFKEVVLGLIAMEAAGALVAALTGEDARRAEALASAMRVFRARVARDCLDPTTRALVQAAESRGIPWFPLNAKGLVQLGYGRFSRRLAGSMPDSQGLIAGALIAADWPTTRRVLGDLGLPVPAQGTAANADEAAAVAQRIGYPVVMKPAKAAASGTPPVPLRGEAAVREAFAGIAALAVVEQFLPGALHRLLVVDGRLVAAARRNPNRTAEDVTAQVHPDVKAMAELAATAIGLAVAGIDFVTPDIGRSWQAAGAICAVTADPGLQLHLRAAGDAAAERARAATHAILDLLFPPHETHHLPIAAVTGTNGKTTTATMLSHMLREAGRHVGLVSTIGTRIDGAVVRKGDLAGARGFNMVAHHPKVDAVVAEVARGSLIKRGMGFQRCDAGVVTNVTTDHLGELGVETLEDMARVKEVVAQAVTGTLVLNADDPLCLAMAGRAQAEQVCLVSMEDDCPELLAHVATGGRGARLTQRDGQTYLTLCGPDGETEVIAAAGMPASFGGLARHNLQNALFAAGMAQGLGVSVEQIRRALANFHCDRRTVPGRMNVFDGHPFKVILDYGHNPGGYRVVGPLITAMAAGKGRRICVFTSPADRNDAHLAELAEAAAPHFDYFICRQGLRQNREPGEVPDKLRDALIANGIAADHIATSGDPEDAVRAGLAMAKAGDVVYVMSTPNPDGSFWQIIETFGKAPARPRMTT